MSSLKKVTRNVTANLVGRLWSMISIYIFIPLYILFLGEEAYGLVTFFATLQAAMQLLSLGLSSTLRREFASGEETDDNKLRKYKLLRTVETIYFLIAFTIIVICYTGAEFIAGNWLNTVQLTPHIVASTIRLMGVSIALQILTSLYNGCLLGLEHQVMANIYQVGWSICKSIGAILILWLLSVDLRLFYIWHIVTDILYFLVLRITIVKKLKYQVKLNWEFKDSSNIKEIWRYAAGLMLISAVAVVNKQFDKVMISKFLPLTVLGAYNSVYILGSLSSIFASSVSVAIFAVFTRYYTTGNREQQEEAFLRYNKAISLIVICIGVFIATYSSELLLFWTKSELLVFNIGDTAAFLIVIGCMFLSLQEIPYAFVLSRGNTKINNVLGLTALPFVVLITYPMISNFGVLGAAVSFFASMLITTLIYISVIHKKYMHQGTLRWVFKDTILPIMMCIVFAEISKFVCNAIFTSLINIIVFAIACGTLSLLLLFIILDRLTLISLKNQFKTKFRGKL